MRLRVGAKAWRMRKVLIGTSGWTYDGWHGPFYPENLRKNDWLSWYATQFPTAEINGSFYRTPSLDAVRKWRDQTPKNFVFAWKASKFITHWKRLGRNVSEFDRVDGNSARSAVAEARRRSVPASAAIF